MNSADLVAGLREPIWEVTPDGTIPVVEIWRADMLAAADRIEALEAWKAEAMEVLHWYASAEPVQLYRDFEIAEYQSRARRLVEKEDGR